MRSESEAGTVREPGEYAVRGGIIDMFPPGQENPVRLDLFGDDVEGIRQFDALSQRTTGRFDALRLYPVSEVCTGGRSLPTTCTWP